MASRKERITLDRKRYVVLALCKRLSLDPKLFLDDIVADIKCLCTNILKSSQSGAALENNGDLLNWISYIDNFSVDPQSCLKALTELNADFIKKSVISGGGIEPSLADIIVFAAIHSSVIVLMDSDRDNVPHLLRWMDYIQVKEDSGEIFERILLKKAPFEPPPQLINAVANVEAVGNTKKFLQDVRDGNSSEAHQNTKSSELKKVVGDKGVIIEKETAAKAVPEKVADEKDREVGVSMLKIQVGLIRKAWKHPSADSLLVEDIDVGETKLRQVVSGLAKYCSPDQLMNRRVVLITNVKSGKLRDVMSEGLVLCASNKDHTIVEPLLVPEGTKIGECVSFSGFDGKPEDVLNPKKKQLDKITLNLFTDDKGVATFKGIPFMTTGGPCTSSIPNASIK